MKKKPNIIVFMTDQQNADTVKPWHKAITPNIDKFSKKAIRFNEAYTVSPHCCPARASFFTGLYPSEHGVWNNVEVDNALSRGLFDDIKAFPQHLQEQGYKTYFTGKWHVSALEGPLDRGFDVVLREYISNYGRTSYPNKPIANDWKHVYKDASNIKLDTKKDFGEVVRSGYPKYYQFGTEENPFGDSISVELGCEAIKNHDKEEPFFMFVGTTGPHDPYCPPQAFIDLYKDIELELPQSFNDPMLDKPALYRRTKEQFGLSYEEQIESLRHYLAFVSYEDSLFGNILNAVQDKGIYEDTYIIYLTDHGDYAGAHGLWAKGLPCFREAYNICSIIGGGNITNASQCDELVSMVDFAPTILELANCDQVKTSGKSLVPFLNTEKLEDWRTEIFTQTNGNEIYGIQRAVWNKKWKYVWNTFDYDELYDIENDPNELTNLANQEDYKEIIKEICIKMWQFAKDHSDASTCPYIMVSLATHGPGIIYK